MRLDILFVACGLLVSLPGVQAEASLEKTIASIWDDFKNAVDCGSCQVGSFMTRPSVLKWLTLLRSAGSSRWSKICLGIWGELHDRCFNRIV